LYLSGPQVVGIGVVDPGGSYELWLDKNDGSLKYNYTPLSATPTWKGIAGERLIAHKVGGNVTYTASTTTRMLTFNNITLNTSRMYKIKFGARAIRSSTATAGTFRVTVDATTITGPGSCIGVATGGTALMDNYLSTTPPNTSNYASLHCESAPFQCNANGVYNIGINAVNGAQGTSVWHDYSPFELYDLGEAIAVNP
jgi:hypothetical protein